MVVRLGLAGVGFEGNRWMDVMGRFLSLPVGIIGGGKEKGRGEMFRDLEVRWVILVFGILV